jgi:hypothetical protein
MRSKAKNERTKRHGCPRRTERVVLLAGEYVEESVDYGLTDRKRISMDESEI